MSHLVASPYGVITGVTLVLPLGNTRRMVTYPGAMNEMSFDKLDLAYLANAKHFHLSSIFLQRKLLPDAPRLFREMRRRGLTTSLDTNDDPEAKWDGLEDLIPLVDVLLCTEEELVRIAR